MCASRVTLYLIAGTFLFKICFWEKNISGSLDENVEAAKVF